MVPTIIVVALDWSIEKIKPPEGKLAEYESQPTCQTTDLHTTLAYIYNIAYFGLIVNVYVVNKVSSDYLKMTSGQNLNNPPK